MGGGKLSGDEAGSLLPQLLLPAQASTGQTPGESNLLTQLGSALGGFAGQNEPSAGSTAIFSPGNASPAAPSRPLSFTLPANSGIGSQLTSGAK